MLDIECFTYLNSLLESSMTPTVILATNRGIPLSGVQRTLYLPTVFQEIFSTSARELLIFFSEALMQ